MLRPFYQVRYYKVSRLKPLSTEDATWFGEFDGRFACRQFEVRPDRTLVAPFDSNFVILRRPGGLSPVEAWSEMTLSEFQQVWSQYAQARLLKLAREGCSATGVRYYRMTVPTESAPGGYGPGIQYIEFADQVARRQFEVYSSHVLVSPYEGPFVEWDADISDFAEVGGDDALRLGIRCDEIAHFDFESAWVEHALPRLDTIAEHIVS